MTGRIFLEVGWSEAACRVDRWTTADVLNSHPSKGLPDDHRTFGIIRARQRRVAWRLNGSTLPVLTAQQIGTDKRRPKVRVIETESVI